MLEPLPNSTRKSPQSGIKPTTVLLGGDGTNYSTTITPQITTVKLLVYFPNDCCNKDYCKGHIVRLAVIKTVCSTPIMRAKCFLATRTGKSWAFFFPSITCQLTVGSSSSWSNLSWTASWKALVSYLSCPYWPLRAASAGLRFRNMTRSGLGSPTSGCLHQSTEKPCRGQTEAGQECTCWHLLACAHTCSHTQMHTGSPVWRW